MVDDVVSEPAVSELKEVDTICDRFEAVWQSGGRPRIEDFLGTFSGRIRERLIKELLLSELEFRRRAGEYPVLNDYMPRFPECHTMIAGLLDPAIAETVTAQEPQSDSPHESTPLDPRNKADVDPNQSLSGEKDDSNIGRSIGNFQMISRLGGGGMGAVYRARHRMIDCERAVKLLRPGLSKQPDAVKRFLLEAQAAIASLNHSNIVKAFDVGFDGEEVYLVMELVDGEDLGHLVRRTGPLAAQRAAELMEQAANGLAFAHAAGFVHRDIKPHNMMLTSHGELKILDLGLVRMLEDPDMAHEKTEAAAMSSSVIPIGLMASRLTDGRAILGTLAYMAPEQARNPRNADGRSDIYSLGCTLYFLLAGSDAFTGSTPQQILSKHQHGEFVRPSAIRNEVPPSLESIVMKMMSLAPESRFANAGQVARSLRSWRLQDKLDSPLSLTEPIRYETRDELRDVLIRLGLISEDEWDQASAIAAEEGWDPRSVGDEFSMLRVQPGPDDPRPMISALEHLRHRTQGKSGLSGLQRRHLSLGNADVLRLPRHVIVDRIGAGWKGEVFKAKNVETDRYEALRTFSPDALLGLCGDHPERFRLFLEKANDIAVVKHPVFPSVRSFDTFANRTHKRLCYLSAELVDARPVFDVIRLMPWPNGKARLDGACEIIRTVADALAIAHQNRVLHLDLHDKTVLITESGDVRVVDLGVAELVLPRAIEERVIGTVSFPERGMARENRRTRGVWGPTAGVTLGASGLPRPEPLGTPAIMPPEQWIERSNVSPSVDIYNMGCLLCFLITGSYPFEGESLGAIIQQHIGLETRKSPAVKKLPSPVKRIVAKMLEKNPEDRFQSASEVSAAIAELKIASHMPVTAWRRWMKWLRSG